MVGWGEVVNRISTTCAGSLFLHCKQDFSLSAILQSFSSPSLTNQMLTDIRYVKGDATNPSVVGNKIIAHLCNDVGGWGKGFVVAISNRWKEPERKYREWFMSKHNFSLGEVQFVPVSADTWVANIIGQRDVKRDKAGNPPIRYEAVAAGLDRVGEFAKETEASVHMPRIGCGLAGGTWDRIEPLIQTHLSDRGVAVTVYDFP
jgi:O-acetyl-ADP-ribose deacetylase (regulator of RNase III)